MGVVHAVRFNDWRTYWLNQPSWPDEEPSGALTRTHRVLPSGYAGRLEWLARPFMTQMINRWRRQLREESGAEPVVVAPYPYLAPWVRDVPGNRLVYYNLDEYTLYQPERAEWIREREAELVERAVRTICLSQHQVQALQDRYPARANRIEHFPLGVLEGFLNPAPEQGAESNTVGYVGNLTDRVDWAFVRAVAERCTNLRFVFAGSIEEVETGGDKTDWRTQREAAFRLPNVEHLGRIPQADVTDLYWNAAVNWIPYDPEHPFNKASCPTKIMDAIAGGRPVVSTPVPECTLYPEWVSIAESPAEAADQLRRSVRDPDHDARAQVAFARQHTWQKRAETFLTLTNARTHVES
jgi:glycosyltransferase involved in cell wall biosynthesis